MGKIFVIGRDDGKKAPRGFAGEVAASDWNRPRFVPGGILFRRGKPAFTELNLNPARKRIGCIRRRRRRNFHLEFLEKSVLFEPPFISPARPDRF